MTAPEALDNIIEVINNIEAKDKEIIEIINNLKIVLLNLQIENAHIKENTGIEPIVNNLDKNIESISSIINSLISSNRIKITESIKILYIEINKG